MAGENPRMSTADLRRRLHAAPSTKPVAFPEEAPVPARPVSRLSEIPGIDPSILRATPLDIGTMPEIGEQPTPVPSARMSGQFRRPDLAGLSGHSGLPRSSVPGSMNNPNEVDPACALFGGEPMSSHAGSASINELRAENSQLQTLLEEMRQLLTEASEQEQKAVAEVRLQEEKIAELELKVEELTALAKKPKTSDELEEWADELEKESFKIQQERRLIDSERKQLREDESSLEKQMREMEVSMARERAMLARQETELKRLSNEIQHELESVQRGDAALRDRLSVFQRRHMEVMSNQPTGMAPSGGSYAGTSPSPVAASHFGDVPSPVASANPSPVPKKNDTTGLLRKLFRSSSGEG